MLTTGIVTKNIGGYPVPVENNWAYQKYPSISPSDISKSNFSQPKITPLKSGDLVHIFKTVTRGDILWEGKFKADVYVPPDDCHVRLWNKMFFCKLPALLQRDGKTIHGALEPFSEQGMEGSTAWSVSEYGKEGYDGLYMLRKNDILTVFKKVQDGDVEWQGKMEFEDRPKPAYSLTGRLSNPLHMDKEQWEQLCWQKRPIIIKPA